MRRPIFSINKWSLNSWGHFKFHNEVNDTMLMKKSSLLVDPEDHQLFIAPFVGLYNKRKGRPTFGFPNCWKLCVPWLKTKYSFQYITIYKILHVSWWCLYRFISGISSLNKHPQRFCWWLLWLLVTNSIGLLWGFILLWVEAILLFNNRMLY